MRSPSPISIFAWVRESFLSHFREPTRLSFTPAIVEVLAQALFPGSRTEALNGRRSVQNWIPHFLSSYSRQDASKYTITILIDQQWLHLLPKLSDSE